MRVSIYAILLLLAVVGVTYLTVVSGALRDDLSEKSEKEKRPLLFSHGRTKDEYIAHLKRTEKPGPELDRRIKAVEQLPVWP